MFQDPKLIEDGYGDISQSLNSGGCRQVVVGALLFMVFLMTILCGVPKLLQLWTWLPAQRPADFAVHYHEASSFGHTRIMFDVSATNCQYFRESPISESPWKDVVTVSCAMSSQELDDLYAVMRTNAFDRIAYDGFFDIETATDVGGEFYITLTADGVTYRKDDPSNRLVSGETSYFAVKKAIDQLIFEKKNTNQ